MEVLEATNSENALSPHDSNGAVYGNEVFLGINRTFFCSKPAYRFCDWFALMTANMLQSGLFDACNPSPTAVAEQNEHLQALKKFALSNKSLATTSALQQALQQAKTMAKNVANFIENTYPNDPYPAFSLGMTLNRKRRNFTPAPTSQVKGLHFDWGKDFCIIKWKNLPDLAGLVSYQLYMSLDRGLTYQPAGTGTNSHRGIRVPTVQQQQYYFYIVPVTTGGSGPASEVLAYVGQ